MITEERNVLAATAVDNIQLSLPMSLCQTEVQKQPAIKAGWIYLWH